MRIVVKGRRGSYHGLAVLALLSWCPIANAQILPTDANPTCGVTQPEISNWFMTGSITPNGFVKPADSVTFSPGTNCDFFKWSERMFLWATSPTPVNYHGGGGRVFNSGTFFGVSALANGQRTFIPNVSGGPLTPSLFVTQLNARGKRVTRNSSGQFVEVEVPQVGRTGKAVIRSKSGENVEIESVQIGRDKKPVFLDKSGKVINVQLSRSGRPFVLDSSGKPIEIQRAIAAPDGRTILQTATGSVVGIGPGQSFGEVLMTTTGSFVFFDISVNDMFAYFATCNKTLTGTNCPFANTATTFPAVFPTTGGELTQIVNYALGKGKAIPDPNVLAIEVKTAWVETTGLDVSKYITTTATIPVYTPNSTSPTTLWNRTGTKTVQVALVGIHVVGSTFDHTEMVWATFEHINNAPNATYFYNNSSGTVQKQQDTSVPAGQGTQAGNWLFTAANAGPPFNQQRIIASGTDLQAYVGLNALETIGPSNTIRSFPWGSATNTSGAFLNTQVIAINNSIRSMLAPGDVRANYMFTGATWTFPSGAPTSTNQQGTKILANTGMETYVQGMNCFGCHAGNMLGTSSGFGLSHVYGPLQPLP